MTTQPDSSSSSSSSSNQGGCHVVNNVFGNVFYANNANGVGIFGSMNMFSDEGHKPKKVRCLKVAKYPVGIESHVEEVKKLLDVGGNGRRIVGIWGTSGIGKTTIAKAIWNEIAHKFEGSCFLADVRENSMPHRGLIQLQETLLHNILGKNLKIGHVDEGIGVIIEKLRHKKFLLILDDVDKLEQLDNLAGDDWFGEGSRVIITTKDRGLLDNRAIYEVQKLSDYQALELFSLNALGINEPPNDYLELAQRAIAYAQGLPLAITLVGSHLRNKGVHRWQVILDCYEGEPYTHIERILQQSYDALDDRAKEAFLDIACFFKGEDKDYVPVQIVPKKFIEEFVDKALITIEWGDRILMHDLLANLGKDIVRKESPNDPSQRSRLWFYKDVKRVLMESKGTRNIKGIMVNLPKPAEIILNPECFSDMFNLEIFINRNASLCGHINYLPNALRFIDWGRCQLQSLLPNALRFIDWGRCQLQSLPPNFKGDSLVVFNMPCSRIRQLEGFKHLPNLTSMNLWGCQFLEKIPDLSGIPNIKYLNLSGCTSLVEIDDSVGLLDKLVELNLNNCVKLTRFATRLRLKSLERLYLWGCKSLESFPEIEVEMESLWTLDIQGSGIRELPPSIAYLTGLRELFLGGYFNLTRFATTFRLKYLKELDLSHWERLEGFPEIEVEMESLKADYCENLTITVNSQVSSSNSKLQLLPNLSDLDLEGCNLSKIDFLLALDCWSTLTKLDLSGNNFVIFPICISKFVNLRELSLSRCKSLQEIPEQVFPPRIRVIVMNYCTSLEKIPKMYWVLLDNFTSFEKIPEFSPEDDDMYVSLKDCDRLRGYDITENIFLNQASVSPPYYRFDIELPGDEVPKWFSCTKDAKLVNLFGEEWYDAHCEVSFEIPPNLKWETLRLVLCVFTGATAKILVNGKLFNMILMDAMDESHVRLTCISILGRRGYWLEEPLTWFTQGTNKCQVIFDLQDKVPTPVKMLCGVHLLGHQVADDDADDVDDDDYDDDDYYYDDDDYYYYDDDDDVDDDADDDDQHQDNELPSSASETSLGKRPRGSDFMVLDDDHRANVFDVGDHEAQKGEADHPKRRHTDLNEEPK